MKHRTAGTRAIPNTHNRPLQFPLALSYGIFVTLFFAPYLLGLAIFSEGDFTEHFLPFSIFQQNALLSGLLPLWNPYVNAGHPFLADAQSAVFYPVSNILLLLTGFERSVTGRLYWLQVEAALHLFLACNFTYLLVRRLTGQRMAGFGAGLVFGFSGFLTGYPPLQLGILRTSIWLPLILWLLLPSKTGRFTWTRWLVAAAVHAIAFFAGHPLHIHYFAAFVLLAQNLYILLTVVLRARDRHLWQPLLMRWGGVQCVVAALYIPWLIFAWQTLMSYGGNGDSPTLEEMLWRSIGVFILGESGLDEIWRFMWASWPQAFC